MKKSLKSLMAFALLVVVAFSACNFGTKTESETSDELFVAVADSQIERFDSVELELSEDVKDVTWSSSDESVATIEDGELIGLKAGTTVISAVKGNEKQEQKISVVDNGKKPTINVDYFPIMRGREYKLDTKAYFKGLQLDNTTFTYSVANTAVASIANNALTGVSYGETTVTISLSWRNQTNILTKTVPCDVMKNVAVYTDKAEYTLYTMGSVLGETFETERQIQPTVYYENEKIDNAIITWTSGDESIAIVDTNGKVEAVSYGETYVVGTCEHNGETLSTRKVPVKVKKPHVKTDVTLPIKVGDAHVMIGKETILGEYSFGKIVNPSTGDEYDYTESGADLSKFEVGEYTFVLREKEDAFSAEINMVFADYIVTDKATLQEATAAPDAYVVLANNLEIDSFTSKALNTTLSKGTFNGLGHTLKIAYPGNSFCLYRKLSDFVFKNLSLICTLNGKNAGGLSYRADGNIIVDNCYIETTIGKDDNVNNGGLFDYFVGTSSLTVTNSIVKVNGLNRNETVQERCSAIIARCGSKQVFFTNSYVIADGTLCSVGYGSKNGTRVNNNNREVLYKDEAEFAEAKERNKIVLDGYNQYWDLTGIIPKFK